ncbi:MAG: class I SAM-dependent rRNA methyltransferase [Acidobacteria bacterium]|nr:class I SAM-dependent rRNA methyltransferase [Acidobacteriota bacterium]
MTHPIPMARVAGRGEKRIAGGHPWVYRSDVVDVQAEAGDIVTVVGSRERRLGQALFSDRSQITLRMLTRGDEQATEAVIGERVARAAAYRTSLAIDATAYRLVHGEADLLPSLVVDRYGDWLVLQALSQGMDRLVPLVVQTLVDVMRPTGILARNDPRVRALEGLPQEVRLLYGDVPADIEVREGPVSYLVDPWKGQKTGLFLDQRENREAAARYARGRLLDCFSYNGGFGLYLAGKCASVECLDVSEEAVSRTTANAERNGIDHLAARAVNVFDELRSLERDGARYDTIVLDPPAFAKNKASVPQALSGYKEINLRAMRLLPPGGVLVTCSCSYNVDEVTFLDVVREAASDSRISMAVVERRTQGRDHPALLGAPETSYLKCLILRRLE